MPDQLEPGWYADTDDPTRQRYWTGAEWVAPSTGPSPPPPEQPGTSDPRPVPTPESNRQFLWASYIIGALIPLYGWGVAIYLAVGERRAAIRRHAIGIAAVAFTAAAIYAVIIVSANSAHADRNAASDLQNLLTSKGITATNVNCVHQGGNQYQCSATISGQQQFASVTDDGREIYEQGISTSP